MGNASTALKDFGSNSYAYSYLNQNLKDSTPSTDRPLFGPNIYRSHKMMMSSVAIGAALGTAFHESIGIESMYMGTIAGALVGCAYMKLVDKDTGMDTMMCVKEAIAAAATVYVVNMVAGDSLGQAKMIVGPAAAYFGTMLVGGM